MSDQFKREMGERLRDLRIKRGLKQKGVAEVFDISITGVGKWERGESTPEADKLPLIAGFYNVSIDWLLTGDEPLPEKFAEKVAVLSTRQNTQEPNIPMKDVASQSAELIQMAYDQAGIEISISDLMRAAIDMATDLPPASTWTELKPAMQAEMRSLRRFLETQKNIEKNSR